MNTLRKWMPVLLFPFASGLVASEARSDSRPELMIHWSFDQSSIEGEKVMDKGPHGYHGTIKSQNELLPESVDGIRGKALRFPAKHQAWIEVDPRFNLQPPFTLTTWLKLSSGSAIMEILGQKARAWDQGMRLTFSTRKLMFGYHDGDQDVSVSFYRPQTKKQQWVYIAVVHDGREIALYIDAEEVLREAARPLTPSRRPIYIGNYPIRKDLYPFVGTMDEMIIFDGALSQKELLKLGQQAILSVDTSN